MSTHPAVDIPKLLEIAREGGVVGRSRRYERRLGDLRGVYRDGQAWESAVKERGADDLAYWVDDHRYQEGSGALIVGTSTVMPGQIGDEFAVTRGHIHSIADRAELYYCLSGHGVILMDTLDGQSSAIELTAGKAVDVPGHWIHRSVNVGREPFVTLFCYAADAGQDYSVIEGAHGMKHLVVADGCENGWTLASNPDHRGYNQYAGD